MDSRGFIAAAGAAGVVGGLLWVVGTVIHALRPVGCVAAECDTRAMRESSVAEGVLGLAALLLFAVATAALIVLVRRAGRFGALGRTALMLAAVGATLLVFASLVQALVFDGDFPLMPYFVLPGIAAMIIGVVLLAWVVLRSGVLPRWAALSLVVGCVTMVGFNEQTHAAWLAVPFGLAWIVTGYALWSSAYWASATGTRDGRP